jgi:hypothetical protein
VSTLAEVFRVALFTDLATARGVLPFAWFTRPLERWPGVATPVASGMIAAAPGL